MAQFLSAATHSKIELRRDRLVTLSSEHVVSETPVALAAIQGAFRCVEVVGAPVDAKVIETLLQQSSGADGSGGGGNPTMHAGAGTPSVAWCGEQDGSVSLRQLTTGSLEQRFPAATRGVFPSAVVSVCGMEVWVGYTDGSMRIFSPFRKTALVEFRAHSTTVSAVLFTSLGVAHHGAQFVVSASTDWTIVVWDALRDFSGQAPRAVSRVAVAKSPIRCLASAMYCADEDAMGGGGGGGGSAVDSEQHALIAAGCGSGSVLMLELDSRSATVNLMWESPPQQHSVNAVAFIKTFGSKNVGIVNGIASALRGGRRGGGGGAADPLGGGGGSSGATNALLVAYCSNNGAVLAREALSGAALFVIEKRPSAVLSLAADPASGLLWVGGSDGIITVYNATAIVKPSPQQQQQQLFQRTSTDLFDQPPQQAAAVAAAPSFAHVATLQHHGGAYVSAIKCFAGNSAQRRLWTCSDSGEMQCFLLAAGSMSVADIVATGAPRGLDLLRAQILRNGQELHSLRAAAWRLRLREQLCLERFTTNSMKASAFIGGPGWELAAMGLENMKMFTIKQRRYMIALQRSSYGGFREAIRLARRYFLKWTYFAASNRYRASSLLVAQMFKNVHRFDVQARYLGRLWRETLRIEREAQLRNIAGALSSAITTGRLRMAFRRWLQWLTSRRSFRSARKICAIIGKSTDQALLSTYWNALVYAAQHREKLDKFGGALDSISRLTSTSMLKEYFRKWRQLRKHNASVAAFSKTIDTRGKNAARECLGRYFRRWAEYFAAQEVKRLQEEMVARRREQEEWEQMIMCDRAAMRMELDERRPRLLQQLAEEEARVAEMEAQLHAQENRNAAIQRETLFVNEDLPIDPNAPMQEQVACVIEFLKARAIHCYHDIKLVGELSRKALATLQTPPRIPGGPAPVVPPVDQPFGMALLYAKQVYMGFVKDKGLLAMRLPSVKDYTPTPTADDIKRMVAAAGKTATPPPATAKAPAAKPGAKPSAKPAAKPAASSTRRDETPPPPKPRERPPPEPDMYRTYWGVPLDLLDDARRSVAEEMVFAAKQLIVAYDTVHARGLLLQRQATGAQKAALAHINPSAAGAYHIRREWLNEFLVNAHLFLRVSIDEYRKRQKQGIETGGIDEFDRADRPRRDTPGAAPAADSGAGRRPGGAAPSPKPGARRPTTPTPTAKSSAGSKSSTPTPTPRPAAKLPTPAPRPTAVKSPVPAPKPVAKAARAATPKPGAKR